MAATTWQIVAWRARAHAVNMAARCLFSGTAARPVPSVARLAGAPRPMRFFSSLFLVRVTLLLVLPGPVLAERPALPPCAPAPIDVQAPVVDFHELRGRVVLIDFWASWCAPCAHAFGFLNALQDEFGARGLTVVGISVDKDAADARRFLQRYPASFPTAIDSGGECPRAFGVKAMPSSYLVDREGRVVEVHRGFRNGDVTERRRAVMKVLDEARGGGR
jgi:peroxiredoxin